jgi:Leucine Rich repeat
LNEITSDGIERMEKSLKYTAIRVLNLTRNPLKNKGAKAIGDMLVRGSEIKIEILNLTECQITH